jgi:hypothetical protein
VRGRARWLPLLAAAALGAQVLVDWALRAAFGLGGVAAGLAVTTALVLLVLLAALGAVQRVVLGVGFAAFVCGGLAVVSFGLPRLVVGPVASALVGLVVYSGVLAVWRPAGLRHAWAYLRTLQ